MVDGSRLAKVAQDFQAEAETWDHLARRYHTRYDEMLDDLMKRLRLPDGAKILDLGCGTGILAEMLLEQVAMSSVSLLDFSANMIEVSERRLNRFGERAKFFHRVFQDMPPGPYDAVVSTLAIHHLESGEEKRSLYLQVLDQLAPGGSFWQGEYVSSSSIEDYTINESSWGEWLATRGFSGEEVEMMHKRVAANDRPASLMENLAWLQDVGFTRVDCSWRYLKFAVFGGWKEDRT